MQIYIDASQKKFEAVHESCNSNNVFLVPNNTSWTYRIVNEEGSHLLIAHIYLTII